MMYPLCLVMSFSGAGVGGHIKSIGFFLYPCRHHPGGKAGNFMEFRKTRREERGVYRYPVSVADGKGGYREEYITIKPGEDGVTEMHIKSLYAFDDSEIYYNIKNSRPQLTNSEKAVIKDWEDKHMGEEIPKNWNLSIESLEDEGICQDKSKLLAGASYSPFEEVSSDVERLCEVVQMLTPEQQEIYRRVLIEGEPAQEVAKDMGIPSKQAMNNRLNKIKAQIKKLF